MLRKFRCQLALSLVPSGANEGPWNRSKELDGGVSFVVYVTRKALGSMYPLQRNTLTITPPATSTRFLSVPPSSDTGAAAAKREKRRAHAQQAAALRQKVSVLLCQPLLTPPPPSATAGGESGTASPKAAQQSAKELRKKMAVLGMIHGPQAGAAGTPLYDAAGAGGKSKGGLGAGAGAGAGGRGAPEERAAAQTRWLDGSEGAPFGGAWAGSVRRGASCDCTSREVRARVEAAKQAGRGGGGGGNGKGGAGSDATTAALAKWNPNPDTPDPERWGGRWGKPCGHNEVSGLGS